MMYIIIHDDDAYDDDVYDDDDVVYDDNAYDDDVYDYDMLDSNDDEFLLSKDLLGYWAKIRVIIK